MGDDAFVLGSPVREIHQDDGGVTVGLGARHAARGLIVAIPTCVSGFIRYFPPLPPDRAQFIQRLPLGSAIKIHLIYDRAFWRDAGLSGNSLAIDDSIVPQTLDAGGPAGVGEPGILACFLDDDGARDLGRMDRDERQAPRHAGFGAPPSESAPRRTPSEAWPRSACVLLGGSVDS